MKLQAKALLSTDEEDSCAADTAWVKLADTPLEFTICRESYDDAFSGQVLENKELAKLIKLTKLCLEIIKNCNKKILIATYAKRTTISWYHLIFKKINIFNSLSFNANKRAIVPCSKSVIRIFV